jgi:hypothetical protein
MKQSQVTDFTLECNEYAANTKPLPVLDSPIRIWRYPVFCPLRHRFACMVCFLADETLPTLMGDQVGSVLDDMA